MAKLLTFSEAQARFSNLATTGIGIADAIQEAIDRIYEMGRWPGTTVTLDLADEDFVTVDGETFLYFVESTYDGMIGFKNDSRGWDIMDHTILFRDGVNGGDLSIIDMGTVSVTAGDETVLKRKYRMPLGFSVDYGPFQCLMKLEAPQLVEDTIMPVQSIGALKCAIIAVCYEYVADEDRANLNWQKFDQFIKLSERQVEGPKRYYVGMDSSLRRHPKQFM